jgi:hypothetical protein
MTKLVFTDKNISGIAGRGSKNKPERLQSIRNALSAHAEGLEKLAEATGLTASNVSGILARAGIHAEAAIKV